MTAEGFDEYARVHRPRLVRAAYLLTGDAGLAEDLVQATLLRIWQRWDRVSSVSNVDGYVYQVMFTRFVSWRRRLWSGEHPHADIPEREQELPDVVSRLSLEAAIRLLPPRQRAVLILRYYLDLSEADAAEAMGCSVGTVKSQSSRALGKLRANVLVVREESDPIRSRPRVVLFVALGVRGNRESSNSEMEAAVRAALSRMAANAPDGAGTPVAAVSSWTGGQRSIRRFVPMAAVAAAVAAIVVTALCWCDPTTRVSPLQHCPPA